VTQSVRAAAPAPLPAPFAASRRMTRSGMSPVPLAASSTTAPGCAAIAFAIAVFQRRWMRRLNRSQSRS
jgi:hypothetical protein